MIASHILIIEDDPEISQPLAQILKGEGYAVSTTASAEAAADILRQGAVDLILLDVMLPGENGLELCRRLRSLRGSPRIIMLTALSEPTDKVLGLEVGADDYVCKPFDVRELLARIRAVLRRSTVEETGSPPGPGMVLSFAGFSFHPYRRFLRSPSGLRIPLTGAEADLLLVLCQNAGKVLSRDELISLTRGEGFAIATRSVDLLVSRLRRKLTEEDALANPIQTIRADGYAFQPDVKFE